MDDEAQLMEIRESLKIVERELTCAAEYLNELDRTVDAKWASMARVDASRLLRKIEKELAKSV